MRKALLLALLCLIPSVAFGQYTTVTSTVTDSAGTPYALGNYSISLVNTTGLQPLLGGNANFQQTFQGGLTLAGSLSVSLPSVTQMYPSGMQWKFFVCANAQQTLFEFPPVATPCFNYTTTGTQVSGSSVDLSSSMSAVATAIPKTPSTTGTNTWTSAQTFTGPLLGNGTNTFANLDGTLYVGGAAPQIGASADIQAQLNAAYAAASTNGQKAILLPQTGGGCYASSVPLVFNTQGKYFPVEGTYTANQTGANPQGSCINFTPTGTLATTAASVTSNVATFTFGSSPITFGFLVGEALNITGFTGGDTYFNGVWSISTVTSTQITATQPGFSHADASAATNGSAAHTAITLDYTVTQGGGFTPNTAFKNIIWLNNGVCLTVGGCGSSTVGMNFGPNAGLHSGELQNVSIRGFQTPFTVSNTQTGNISWSMKFNNVWVAYNSTGFSLTNLATSEALKWTGGGFANNGTGFSCGASITTDVTFDTVSFDSNSVAGINNAGCVLTLIAPHFENSGGTGASNAYIVQSNGEFTITGGRVMEDLSAGGPTAQFFQMTGGSCNINGLNASSGRTVTNLIANSGGFCHVSYFTDAPTLVAPGANNEDTSKTCSVAYFCVVERIITNPAFNFQAAQFPVLYLTGPGAGSPAGVGGGFPLGVMYYNGSLNRTNLQDNGTAADNVNGTNNVLTASSTDNVTNKSFGAGGLVPVTAGATDIGSTSKPFGNLWLGTAATNNFKFQPAATAAARTITISDPLGNTNLVLTPAALSVRNSLHISDQGTACANGNIALSAGWGTTAAATAAAGQGQTCQWTITSNGTGQAANPTITWTLPTALPSANVVCSGDMKGGTQTFTSINQTTLSSTAPVFTFNGTPVAGNTVFFLARCGP